jgi:hypothetical protein
MDYDGGEAVVAMLGTSHNSLCGWRGVMTLHTQISILFGCMIGPLGMRNQNFA